MIKLALAASLPGVQVAEVVQVQRRATMNTLHDLTRLKANSAQEDLPWRLVLENHIFTAEAELRWLDHIEAMVAAAESHRPASPPACPTPRAQTARENTIPAGRK